MKTLVVDLRDRVELVRPRIPDILQVEFVSREPAAVRAAIADTEILLTSPSLPVTAALLDAAPRLRLIQLPSAGYDKVDLAATRARGIPVANAAGANAATVAEHVFLVAMALQRRLLECHAGLCAGDFAGTKARLMAAGLHELAGKTLGIIGLGRIGKQVARRAAAFDLRTLYYDIVRPAPEEEAALQVTFVPMDALLAAADILTVHVPLDASTYHLVGERELARLRPTALVINAARGPVVDPAPLAQMIEDGRLGGAAVDVFEEEPAPPTDPLMQLARAGHPRLILTPHVAGVTSESTARGLQQAFDNAARFARGEPLLDVVNGVAAPGA
jgi:glyoxylate reductase/D-3-phosphoglycerate dehydrogenase